MSDNQTNALIFHASKVMFKILHARLQHYMNQELPDIEAGFRKGKGTGGRIYIICLIREKAREFQKNIYHFFIDYTKAFRDTKGTFHAKMGLINDRNGMDLTEAENIKKRWKEYTEELYKKYLHNPDSHDDVITNLEQDILECEVKWALESITTNKVVEVMELQLSCFKS